MRALLEFRLSDRWKPLLLTECAALAVAALLLAQGIAPLESPSAVILVAGLFALAVVWYDARRVEMADRGEKREALHGALPTTRLEQALARAVEPLVPLLATVLLVSLAFVWVGRSGDASWTEDLRLFLGAAVCLLLLEWAQLVALESQLVLRRHGLTWIFWVAMAVIFGGPGLAVGYAFGDGDLVPFIFHLTLGDPTTIATLLVLALLLALLSVRMYRVRDALLGTC